MVRGAEAAVAAAAAPAAVRLAALSQLPLAGQHLASGFIVRLNSTGLTSLLAHTHTAKLRLPHLGHCGGSRTSASTGTCQLDLRKQRQRQRKFYAPRLQDVFLCCWLDMTPRTTTSTAHGRQHLRNATANGTLPPPPAPAPIESASRVGERPRVWI